MDSDEIADDATRLLLQVAAGNLEAATQYDALLFEYVLAHIRRRGHLMAATAVRLTGSDLSLPFVNVNDMEEVAHDTAVRGLERARASAARFNPTRGNGATWAMQAAAFAYIDVVRARTGSRRRLKQVPSDHADLILESDRRACETGPELRYEHQEALDRALRGLESQERKALLLHKQWHYSYAEIAHMLFDDVGATKAVDRLLQSAVRKIRRADRDYRAAGD